MIISLVLFGSRARGDHRLNSDVDMLGVVEGGAIKDEVAVRGASFYRYPLNYLRERSECGDLFVLHLVSEGRILHDTGGLFADICHRFTYKLTYEAEIREASAIALYIISRKGHNLSKKVRKRLVWAFRTIIIANAAQQKRAVFSSSDLQEYAKIDGIKEAIDRRNTIEADTLVRITKKVVSDFGNTRQELQMPRLQSEQNLWLRDFGGMAGSTLELFRPGKKTGRPNAIYE
jgi:hypothetical protein